LFSLDPLKHQEVNNYFKLIKS